MIRDQIADDLKEAMRARDAVRRRTLRSLSAALHEAEIGRRASGPAAPGEEALTEEQELVVVRKQAKQRRDAIEQYEAAGREDLAQKEREELEVIAHYLPQPLADDELRRRLEAIIDEVGASSMQDMGRVMGAAMSRLRGRADGSRVQQHVRALLSGEAS